MAARRPFRQPPKSLSASIREIATQVGRTSTVTKAAVAGREQARSTIQALAGAVKKIAEVSDLIGGIAGQTNLLALKRHDRGGARRRGRPRLCGRRRRR